MAKKPGQKISRLLIMIFALYYVNICFCFHSHIINGTTIVHSHIHSKSHAQAGTHSDSELTLISTLSSLQTLQASLCFSCLGVFLILLALTGSFRNNAIIPEPAACVSLRAPPFQY